MSELQKMIEYASGWAEERFRESGHVSPMWHAVQSNGEAFVVIPDADKDHATIMTRALFELKDVVRCVFIDEAWSARGRGEEDSKRLQDWIDEHGHIHDFPGRMEVVVFVGEDQNEGLVSAQREIERPKRGKARLGPLTYVAKEFNRSEGRFIGMLPRRGAKVS